MPELVINVSNILSPLCYSLIRVEPYSTCIFRCIYCYSRWYWVGGEKPKPRIKALINFKSLARKIYERGLKPIPARLATLTDPFQPVEKHYKMSYKIMKIALKYSYPLIINTKSSILINEPWIRIVKELAASKLLIVQFSLSSFDEYVTRKLEPLAPPVSDRLDAMKKLSEEGVPVVLRLSPYIPGVTLKPHSYDDIASLLRDIGVKQVIVEGLRLPLEEWNTVSRILGIKTPTLNKYNIRVIEGGKPLYKPALKLLLNEYVKLMEELKKYGIGFSTCKEGLFSLHTVPDCCGFYMFSKYAKRITLYELFLEAMKQPIPLEEIKEKYTEICSREEYVCNNKMNDYPKRIRKPFKAHERKLLRIIEDKEKLSHITPELVVENGYLKARPIVSRLSL